VELLDVVLSKQEGIPGLKDEIHGLRVAYDFFFVARLEGVLLKIREQRLNLAVGELDAFNPGRGAD
jgi:hypothetical protein